MSERPEITTMISHRIPLDLLAALDVLAESLDRPRSRLMNEAYRDLLSKYAGVEAEPVAVQDVAA